eukprot:4799673-Lingulodinium_polyedra.AAC.1
MQVSGRPDARDVCAYDGAGSHSFARIRTSRCARRPVWLSATLMASGVCASARRPDDQISRTSG